LPADFFSRLPFFLRRALSASVAAPPASVSAPPASSATAADLDSPLRFLDGADAAPPLLAPPPPPLAAAASPSFERASSACRASCARIRAILPSRPPKRPWGLPLASARASASSCALPVDSVPSRLTATAAAMRRPSAGSSSSLLSSLLSLSLPLLLPLAPREEGPALAARAPPGPPAASSSLSLPLPLSLSLSLSLLLLSPSWATLCRPRE
jgi:hypothetical protein